MDQELREINWIHLSMGKHFDKSDAGTLRTKELIFLAFIFRFFFLDRQAFVLLSALKQHNVYSPTSKNQSGES